MATIRVAFVTSEAAQSLAGIQKFDPHAGMARVANLVAKMDAGAGQVRPGSVQITVDQNATQATATVICITVANNSTVSFGSVTLTGKTGTPSGQAQWKCGVSATADGAALAACINANTSLNTFLSAASVSGTVTVTGIGPTSGILGNILGITSSDGTNLAVTAFTGGVADSGAVNYSF